MGLPRSMIMSPTLVTVTIGDYVGTFHFFPEPLTKKSGYFQGCLASGMKESQSLQVHLDIDEDFYVAFGHFAQYIFKDCYDVPGALLRNEPIPEREEDEQSLVRRCREQMVLHARIYVLADRLCCDGLGEISYRAMQTIFYLAQRYTKRTTLLQRSSYDYQYDKEWRGWYCTKDYEGYRNFCNRNMDHVTGNCSIATTLFKFEDLSETLRVVFEGSTERVNLEKYDLRKFLGRQCAKFYGEWKISDRFLEFLFEDRDFFNSVMSCVRSKPLA